jgi:hypothetical protein
MKKTNTLTSHTPESSASRADKMSGLDKEYRGKVIKHIAKKKRRQLLKNYNNNKI